MRNVLLIIVALIITSATFGQLTGVKNIPGAGGANDYATIAAAVTALNTSGVGAGGVTFEVAANHVETSANILLTTNTASAANPIVFIKFGAGANPLVTAGVGVSTTVDGIIKIQGTDYVTFNGIDVVDPVSNLTTTTRMEWGYAILMTSATDASQNITLVNCNITLQKAYTASPYSSGIYSKNHNGTVTTAITPTAATGVVSNCTVDNCNISDVIYGINWNGYSTATYYGNNNHFGYTTGNTITNFGGAATAPYGMYFIYQNNLKVANNNITGGAGTTTTEYGIYLSTGTNSNVDVSGNTINLTCAATTSTVYGIYSSMGASGTNNTVTLYNNTITVIYPTATTGIIYGIYHSIGPWHCDINNNNIIDCVIGSASATATGSFYGLYTFGSNSTAGSIWNINQNNISGNSRVQSTRGGGATYAIYNTSSGLTLSVNENTVMNNSWPSSGVAYGIYVSNSGATALNILDNLVRDISKPGALTNITPKSGNLYGIYISHTTTNGITTESGNSVYNLTNTWGGQVMGYRCDGGATSTFKMYRNNAYNLNSNDVAIFGIYSGAGVNIEIYRNSLYNFNATVGDSAAFYGICTGSTTAASISSVYNNYLSDMKATYASVFLSSGLYLFGSTAGTTHRYYNNSVYLDHAVLSGGGTAAIFANTAPILDMRNNVLVNNSTGGFNAALWRSNITGTTLAASSNNNCLYAGTPSANNLLYWAYDVATPQSAQTMGAYQTYFPQEGQSFTELPPFVNIGALPYDLRMGVAVATACESGASVVATPAITTDYDLEPRYPNAGYPNNGNPLYAATFPDVGADEFGGIPSFSCTLPNPGNTLASANNLCLGNSTTLSLTNPASGTGVSFQWQSSVDGMGFSSIAGANLSTYTTIPTAPLYYQCVVTCQNGPSTGTSIPVQILFSNTITGTTPGSRCGTGTVSLAATGSAGTTLKWYSASLGGTLLGTGSPFTTPSISTTTSYYVGAETYVPGDVSIGTSTTTQNTTTTFPAPYGNYWESAKHQMLIRASELTAAGVTPGNINYLGFDVASVGTSGIHKGFTIKMANTALSAMTTALVTTGLTTVFGPLDYQPVAGVNTHTFTTPFVWDGTSNVVVETCFSNDPTGLGTFYTVNAIMNRTTTAFTSVAYLTGDNVDNCPVATAASTSAIRPNMWVAGAFICSSARSGVVATVVAPPVLTITAGQTICPNEAYQIQVTSTVADYDTYTWSPVTNLFTDADCLVPYVALAPANPVFVKSATGVTTTYTCSGSNSTTLCSNTATTTVVIVPVAVVNANPGSLCISGSSTLSLSPATGYGTATFQWQDSPDNSTFSDISGATGTSYTTTVLTATRYYKVVIKNGAGVICSEPVKAVVVNNPQVSNPVPGSRCGTGTVQLGATGTAGSVLNWYAASSGGNILGTGSPFTTPSISATTSYFVAASDGGQSGLTIPGDGGWNHFTTSGSFQTTAITGAYMVLTVLQPLTLTSMDIYPSATLGTAFSLEARTVSASGATFASYSGTTTVVNTTTPTVAQTVPVNWVLPAGVYYIGFVSNPNTWRSGSVTHTLPWTLPGVASMDFYLTPSYQYYLYNLQLSTGCESPRIEVVATVTAPPAINPTATPASVCAAYLSTLDVTSANPNYTYNWMPGNLSGATQSVYPETATTYTVTATDAGTGCVTTGTASVAVLTTPTPITITPAAPVITPGATQELVATGGTLSGMPIFTENFNGAFNSWTTVNNSTLGTNPLLAAWTLEPDGYSYSAVAYHSNDNTQFYMSNSDAQGSGGTTNTELISPVINTTGFTALSLEFWHYLNALTVTSAKVEVSLDGGTTWEVTPLANYTTDLGSAAAFVKASVNMTAYINQTNLKIRFKYYDTWGFYWCIDNVALTGTAQPTMAWSPYTELYTDALATTPYNGESLATVYTKPTVARTYTVSSTAPATGCIRTQSVNVSFIQPLAVSGTATDVTGCFGNANGAVNTTVTGGVGPYTYLWSNQATTANLSGLTAWLYTVTVTDAAMATATGSWTINQPAELLLSATSVNANCPTSNDGSIDLTVTNGTPAYGYLWSNSATTQDISGLAPGTYTVVVTDANGCSKSGSWTVGQTNSVCANISVTGAVNTTVCYNALATITVAGGVTTFSVVAPGDATFIAGQNILFKPGTSVSSGAHMHGYISGTFCLNPAAPITAATTGQDEPQMNLSTTNFTIFPNPTSGNFTLVQKGEKTYGTVKVEVYTMNGEKIMTERMIGEQRHEFQFSDIPVGLYFVKIVADDYVETIKLIKTR